MRSVPKRRSAVLVLLIATLAWGCEVYTATDPISTSSPVEVDAPSSLLGGLIETTTELVGSSLDLVRTTVRIVGEVGSELIGPVGGLLEVQDHDLTVPAGAVTEPTIFAMEVLSGRTIEVELTATDADTGVDVGEKGFLRPVQLALSYANANVSESDIDRLVIVRIHEDGTREPLPSTVDRETQQVTAELDHFSKYGLCRN